MEDAAENLRRETRRYAKRQLTWFRRDPEIHWFYPEEFASFEEFSEKVGLCIDQFLKI